MTITSEKLDATLRKINALLTQADHPNTGPDESATFRAKAEALMLQYRIEETQVGVNEYGSAIVPEWRTVNVCAGTSEYRYYYRWLMDTVVEHFGCKATFRAQYDENDEYQYVAEVCGFASDLHFIDALFTNAKLAFQQKLEPRYDSNLSNQENAYIMRNAGMEGRRIAEAIFGAPWTKGNCQKVRNMHKAEAIARGEDPKALSGHVDLKNYRQSYAQAFVSELARRLRLMRNERGEQETALVLVGRDEAIAEAFYERYPNQRPAPAGTKAIGNERAECAKCAKAKSGYCRDHQWMKPSTARGRVKYANMTAYEAGQAAARSVDVGGTERLSQ